LLSKTTVGLDHKWGLDHGAWSVIKHLYPLANIPLIQLSLDYKQSPQYHYELSQQLQKLREKGLLIIGSGNMVHNLGKVDWRRLNENFGFDWAIPTQEHYLPLLYTLALQGPNDKLQFFNPKYALAYFSLWVMTINVTL
jgi:4,5-DOPA dioxygenase extradiol